MNELNQILFQRYLDGDLASSEKKAFEKQLQEDQAFKTDFELFQAMDVFLHKKVRQGAALNQLREVHKEQTGKSSEGEEPKVRFMSSNIRHLAAAMAVVLVAFFGWFVLKDAQSFPGFDDIYEEPNYPTVRSDNASSIELTLEKYLAGNKKDAFDSLYNSPNISGNEKYYWLAELYLKEGQTDSTLKYIPMVKGLDNKTERLKFLKSLVFLQNKDYKGLKDYLLNTDLDAYYKKKLIAFSK